MGQLVQASNGTFLAADEQDRKFLYKPVRGEAPLRDFPEGTLGRREVAAYELSHSAGFDLVPPTFWVEEGPFGAGSAQRWLEGCQTDLVDLVLREEVPEGWMGVIIGVDDQDRPLALVHADEEPLRRMALFDAVVNNADRKGAHIIHATPAATAEEAVYGVDHGLTFHLDEKLRTVLWGWSGEPFSESELGLLHMTLASLDILEPWLDPTEIVATELRTHALLEVGEFPGPGDRWPVIPWPPL